MLKSILLNEGKKTLGEQAYESIREAILSLRLEPGQTVYESEFANMLNMSRTPIREAVRTLLVEELIEVLPQRGMKVALISEQKVEETRFVRESLEVSAIRIVVRQWNTAQAAYQRLQRDLQDSLAVQEEASKNRDFAQFLQADEEFHRLLLGSTNNRTLVSIVSQMRGHLNRVRALSLRGLQNVDDLISEHKQLLEGIESGDEAQVVAILSKHLRRLGEDIHAVKQQFPMYFMN